MFLDMESTSTTSVEVLKSRCFVLRCQNDSVLGLFARISTSLE